MDIGNVELHTSINIRSAFNWDVILIREKGPNSCLCIGLGDVCWAQGCTLPKVTLPVGSNANILCGESLLDIALVHFENL